MPPGDTIIYRSVDELPDSFRRLFDSLTTGYGDLTTQAERPNYPMSEGLMFLILLIVIGLSAYFYVIKPADKSGQKTIFKRKKEDERSPVIREHQYDQWLSRYNPYYHSLLPEHKKRFIHRTEQFLTTKEFRFHAMVEEEYIPVLISAAAVQLTFGLSDYKMDYFDLVHVIRKEYKLNIDQETYYGHVSKKGIHISWSRFMEGYSDYTDSENVGLHEMAHALSYDAYLGFEESEEASLKDRLNEFVEEVRPVFRSLREARHQFYDGYSMSTFDEFWATSVELFFEKPLEFKEKLPHLYQAMSKFLNQDPLTHEKILDHSLV